MKADYDLEERLLEYPARIIRLVEFKVQGSALEVRRSSSRGRRIPATSPPPRGHPGILSATEPSWHSGVMEETKPCE